MTAYAPALARPNSPALSVTHGHRDRALPFPQLHTLRPRHPQHTSTPSPSLTPPWLPRGTHPPRSSSCRPMQPQDTPQMPSRSPSSARGGTYAPCRHGDPLLTARHRRKYRKMRVRFEDTMTASNNLILDEWKAQATARRLREQNECVQKPRNVSIHHC